MGVPAQIEIDSKFRRARRQFRGMGKQQPEVTWWNSFRGQRQTLAVESMLIVHARNPERSFTGVNPPVFVDQDVDTQRLEWLYEIGEIVVSQDRMYSVTGVDPLQNNSHIAKHMSEIAIVGEAVVSTEETNLTFDSSQQVADERCKLRKPIVKVKVRYVQDAIANEEVWQFRQAQSVLY